MRHTYFTNNKNCGADFHENIKKKKKICPAIVRAHGSCIKLNSSVSNLPFYMNVT